MSKPKWSDGPAWAKYLAMDPNGNWIFFELEPYYHSSGLYWVSDGREYTIPDRWYWQRTLEQRPRKEHNESR